MEPCPADPLPGNLLSAIATFFLAAITFVLMTLAVSDCLALEIYRNGRPYDIKVELPPGYDFQIDKIDRKFLVQGLAGNIRLIQDNTHPTCDGLVDDRRANWVKYGFTRSSDRYVSASECSIEIQNPTEAKSANSFYIRSDACACFIALQFSYDDVDRADYDRFGATIVTSVRRNNSSSPSSVSSATAAAIRQPVSPQPSQPSVEPSKTTTGDVSFVLQRIRELSCQDLKFAGSLADAVVLLSAWDGRSVDDFGEDIGLPNIAALLTLNRTDIDSVISGQIAIYEGQTVSSIDRYVSRFGQNLCPILGAVMKDGFPQLIEKQRGVRSYYQGAIYAAQQIAMLNGCYSGPLDKSFGPSTRLAWARVRSGSGLPALSEGHFLNVPDVIDTASKPMSSGACDNDVGEVSLSALQFIKADVWENRNWLEKISPGLTKAFDMVALSGHWTAWTERLALNVVESRGNDTPKRSELMIATIYSQGIGVASNENAARHWRDRSQDSADDAASYKVYLAGIGDEQKAAQFVRSVVQRMAGTSSGEKPDLFMSGPLNVPNDVASGAAQFSDLARLCTLIALHPSAFTIVLDEASSTFQYAVAERLLAGVGSNGKQPELAAKLLQALADRKVDYASLRLAFLYLNGFGVPQDRKRAYQLFELAAQSKLPLALVQLAAMTEEDRRDAVNEVVGLYRQAIDIEISTKSEQARLPVEILTNRIMRGGPLFSSPEGKGLVDYASKIPNFSKALAKLYLCTRCGNPIDLDSATRWLREAAKITEDHSGSALLLVKLLEAKPDLRTSPGEVDAIMKANTTKPQSGTSTSPYYADVGLYLQQRFSDLKSNKSAGDLNSALNGVLDEICSVASAETACEKAQKLLASGLFGGEFVELGINRLMKSGSYGLIDVLAAYGDFSGALQFGKTVEENGDFGVKFPIHDSSHSASDLVMNADFLRSATFRRLFARRNSADMDGLPSDLVPLLRFLSNHGDLEARSYLSLLSLRDVYAASPTIDVTTSAATFDKVLKLGGASRALVNVARSSSLAFQFAGNSRKALEMELVAVAADVQLDKITALSDGPLQTALTQACQMSHASERAFALGESGLAMVFAKESINDLQQVRSELVGVPERLQGCFRDLVSDNYRWLANLLIQQNRLSEAQFVLGLLKDFETLEYVERDPAFVGQSFQLVPFSQSEARLKEAVFNLQPALVPRQYRIDELLQQQKIRILSASDSSELSDLQARVEYTKDMYGQGLKSIFDALDAVNQADNSTVLGNLSSAQSMVDADTTGETAVVHFLVLPDRLNIILSTHQGRKRYIITSWNGEPFSEKRLDAEIAKFHGLLQDRGSDPTAESRVLYDLLIRPMARDLTASNAKLLLFSLDRRLRYIPFNALNDGTGYLVEKYDTSILTNSGSEIAGTGTWGAPFAGLGTTRAAPGFDALPGVAAELSGIVKGSNGQGLLSGEIKLDKDFSKPALQTALSLGKAGSAGVGIVHIASHFSLGDSDADSFLLLGTGDHLTLKEIKDQKNFFDFGRVDLLTLSACSTGFANPDADGRDIESLAKVTSDRGAKSTLASLWPVADTSTALLMQRFYELRERGRMSKTRAIGTVQREFIHGSLGSPQDLPGPSVIFTIANQVGASKPQGNDGGLDFSYSHPFFWAPFVLTGNWR